MWVLYSIAASLFWGLTYVFNEQVYKKISVLSSIGIAFLCVSILTLTISYFSGNLKPDLAAISSSRELFWYVLGGTVVLLIAELFIGFSITSKNATLAGLIEISYPIFIALFTYLFYKTTVSWQTFVGGLCIFVGIFIISFFNR